MGEPSLINTGVLQQNPFPGIRPFTSAEDRFFFGREEAVKEVLDLLFQHQFVALVGASGTGKTSLIQSGIIPFLLNDNNKEWVPVVVRPGPAPLESLVRGFQQVFPKKIGETDVTAFLSGSLDLGTLLSEKGLGSHSYYLVIDQFEELFRSGLTARRRKKTERNPDAVRFVDVLLRSLSAERPEISLMISVRSDFLDECSAFRELTEQMNRSKYLLPHMSRESLARAILGPIRQAGATVEAGFEDYLIDDLEQVETKLPMMQHALMRTWDHWIAQGSTDQPISIGDYQAVGTIRHAISNHLDEAYQELTESQQQICERIFKSITFKSEQLDSYRKRVSLANIARIAQCNFEDVADVVEAFRKSGRSFILPPAGETLKPESLIELSHESIIRIWDRLKKWVDEESASVQVYLKLSEASALYQQGRTELWKPPELQLALAWRDEQNPTPAWGVQYDPAFERAMVFLNTSEEEFMWEEERKVVVQRRRLILNRAIASFMGALVIVLSVIFLVSRNREAPQEALNQTEQTTEPYAAAEIGQEEPSGEYLPGGTAEPVNEGGVDTREESGNLTEDVAITGEQDEISAELPEVEPPSDTERDNMTVREETTQAGTDEDTRDSENRAELARLANQQRMQTIASEVSRRSLEITQDPDLQGLLAYQSYRINAENAGPEWNPDIYNGLYAVLKKLISPAYNFYPSMRGSVKDMVWLRRTGSILAVSSDGSVKILSGNFANRASQINLAGTGVNNECLVVSPDEQRAAIGTNGAGLLFIELENQGNVVQRSTAQGSIILFLHNLGNSGSFVSAGTENRILRWDYSNFQASTLATTSARPSSLTASSDGRTIAYGTRDGGLFELDVQTPGNGREINRFGGNHVSALTYSPGGQYLVSGHLDGSLRIMSGNSRRVVATLRGPGARVTDLEYSPDGRYLVAASHDGNVYLWNTADWTAPPMVFSENNGFVLSVCFNGNGEYFYSGSVDYPRLVGRPAGSGQMVADFCELVTRNLTQAEWNQYFGPEVPYERTCPDLN